MKYMKKLMWLISGIVFITAAVLIFLQYSPYVLQWKIDAQPDYDYISEIKQLIAEQKYGEAKILAQDVINSDLPCRKEAEKLLEYSERKSRQVLFRIYKFSKGFVTGNPDSSIEENGGSIVSDMVIYGDIRDLVKQGYFKISGRETDPVIIALASVGLVTEFVDVADWAPAALKGIRKAGCISPKIADFILNIGKKVIKTGKIDKQAEIFFANTKSLLDSSGFIRTKNIFKNVHHADSLTVFAKHAKINPSATHLIAKHSGAQAVEVFKQTPPEFIKKIIRKGRVAVRLVKTYHKHRSIINMISDKYIYGTCFLLLIAGVFLMSIGFGCVFSKNIFACFRRYRLSRRFKRKKKKTLSHTPCEKEV